jgi:mRNA-degrading endonuclease RelE of RelBE toxin-antitoxin system
MNYSVLPTPLFKKQAKRLAKKYRSLLKELSEFENSISENPTQGTTLGNNAYKIRLSVESKGKGKSGGMRIITYIVTKQREVYLLTIYDKSEMDNIDSKTLKSLISEAAIK